MARRARQILRQNLVWAAGYNLVAIPVAALGLLPPWLAALGMSASSDPGRAQCAAGARMTILYVLVPMGLVLCLVAVWAFFWAVNSGQFENLDVGQRQPAGGRCCTRSGG